MVCELVVQLQITGILRNLEILTHAVDLHGIQEHTHIDAYQCAERTCQPIKTNMGVVRKFYMEACVDQLIA